MSTNTTPEPSAGAVRAAEEIMETLFGPKWQDRKDYIEAAEIIDREAGAGKLAEALEGLFAVDMNCPCEVSNEVTAAWMKAEAALAAWTENNQSTNN